MGRQSRARKLARESAGNAPNTPDAPAPASAAPAPGALMTQEPPRAESTRIAPPPDLRERPHPRAILAVFLRNYTSYFSNPAGYVFITLFVAVCAWAAFWQPSFFANNLANLAPLNEWMPYLLLFFVPAITMNAWADERRLGTDELLLTLPVRDVEVVLGKYFAALGIYTTALVFSFSLVAILYWLGTPDLGVIASTYLGYWLMGALMIAIGLVASVLSSNVTVAFILGAVFSAIPVFAGLLGQPFDAERRRGIEDLSIPSQFRDFGTGEVSLVSVFYFVGLAAAMLYLNMILIGRRQWAGGERSGGLAVHSLARVVALVVALAAADVLLGRWGNAHADFSAEGLHSLSPESKRLIADIPADRPVYIEAYYSEEVPREFVQTKLDLLTYLREFAAASGGRIKLSLNPTAPYSEQAREAEKTFGILPRRVAEIDQARRTSSEIFLGVAFTSGPEEVVVPFFDRGIPVEYELARSIRVVAREKRKKLGIVQTDAKILGGFNFQSMSQNPEWSFVSELKKQYEVSSIVADASIPADIDVVLVAQPSSMTQRQIDNLTAYVRAGKPTLLMVDPFLFENPQISPELPRPSPGGMFGGGQPPEPKGDLVPLMDLLGIDWPTSQIVWNQYNPLPTLSELPPEVVFIGKGGAGSEAFNPSERPTSGLQELVVLFAGHLNPKGTATEFIPLLKTDDRGGVIAWSEVVEQGMRGFAGLNPNRNYRRGREAYTLAARVKGKDAVKEKSAPAGIDAIVIADLDLIGEQFFAIRREKVENLEFDNIPFVLNCVDALSGDTDYVELRKRRIAHRTLTRLEDRTKTFVEQAQEQTKAAEEAATQQLAAAQRRLDEKVKAIQDEKDLDPQTRRIRVETEQERETRRLAVERTNIEDAKRRKILDSRAEMETAVRRIQTDVRMTALLVPPLPALLIGFVVFGARVRRENLGANPNRLA